MAPAPTARPTTSFEASSAPPAAAPYGDGEPPFDGAVELEAMMATFWPMLQCDPAAAAHLVPGLSKTTRATLPQAKVRGAAICAVKEPCAVKESVLPVAPLVLPAAGQEEKATRA
ncbi:hypothetical protein E2562_004796 [Oryza meyeriana var. granulata]|uniref:Uncharacterized protein n=1 Tax=Oryza meyeriana var. granulata TaxID=110450 RepID=A0A6G1DEL0_9ORYZ|nr:hypothetical protein E2562_004796 [Oryza meyeriana var. granulata]